MCCRVTDWIVQVFGDQGYVKGRGIERFYRDVRAARIYEGTSQSISSTSPGTCCADGGSLCITTPIARRWCCDRSMAISLAGDVV
jgi:hypothetical protein